MIKANPKQAHLMVHLFQHSTETLILSYLQGHMGNGWADVLPYPTCGQIIVGDFCFFGGDFRSKETEIMVKHIPPAHKSSFLLMIPENQGWAELIERTYPNCRKFFRYSTKKDTVFNQNKLQQYVNTLPVHYRLQRIDRALYERCMASPVFKDLCSQFNSAEDYLARGLGFCILDGNTIACGCSSYTVYSGGIEVEIDTHEAYRQKGLATICASRLLLECLQQGKYPSWDASGKISLALAEKLGYQFDYEYITYAVAHNPPTRPQV